MSGAAGATAQLSPDQLNTLQRNLVLANALEMAQVIQTVTFDPTKQQTLSFVPRGVGLIKKFIVTVTATLANTDGALAASLTDFGLANLLSNITFTDLNNIQRINTAGWHLSMLNSMKHAKPFASGFMLETDTMGGYGEVYPILNSPATIAHGTSAVLRGVYEIPLAYSDDNLAGSIYGGVTGASMNLSLTINPTPCVATGVDSTLAVYKGVPPATCAFTTITFEIQQVYLDQLPMGQSGVVLPNLDVSTIYEIKNAPYTGIASGTNYSVPYANFRRFISTLAVYDHDTTGDTGRVAGTDILTWAQRSANFSNFFLRSSLEQARLARNILGCDLPKGVYYVSNRKKPINTLTYGNMELVANIITGGANAILYVGYEAFADTSTVSIAGSLA